MNKSNPIEHLLLSRCSKFHEDGEILKLLESRYSVDGTQKNFLVLQSTDGGVSRADIGKSKKKAKISLLSSIANETTNTNTKKRKDNKHNPLRTRNEFKSFITKNMKYQNLLVRRLKAMIKIDPNVLNNVNDITDLHICKNLLKFEDFLDMNMLWNDYIRELIGTSNNLNIIAAKLSTCEMVGSFIEVTHSECRDNIGARGIVIWESQYNFIMVIPRKDNWKADISLIKPTFSIKEQIGGLRLISKKNSRFKLTIGVGSSSSDEENRAPQDVLEFEIIGNRFLIKSNDRANRKFKSHAVQDINV
ncbi:hypothetical protein CANARDRAFT_8441 [[Candida] arabinofermentans NRRL YB-2248]|uniref:Uncharacterized protein n=1 Tax=[Candida] arabinofermentans NRRL YB-2248 TaxID=983967 RepID=A0A1E4SY80_9ASCO|nr:hypothetical protein CANARDRAFT_8441 [[Candida] arabinofermentans NRRL YB-2248]